MTLPIAVLKVPRLTFNWRTTPLHAATLLTLALLPVWYRFPGAPPTFSLLYPSGFPHFWLMLATVTWWLLVGLPGLRDLWRDWRRRTWALALLLLAGWGLLSWHWAFTREIRPEATGGPALQFALVALFAVMVACVPPPRRLVIVVLVVGLVLSSLIGGLQVAAQNSIGLAALGEFQLDPQRSGVSVVQAEGVRWLRPYGLLSHPNILAGALSIGLLAVGAWVLHQRRAYWLAGTLIGLGGLWVLLLTFSRAAWGGFALAAAYLLILTGWPHLRRYWRRYALTVGLALALGVVFFLMYQPFLLARAGVGAESIEQRSVADRVVYTQFALRAMREHPILGVGIGNFPWQASYYLMFVDFDLRGDNVHNVYLSAWAELGLVGLLLLLVALLAGMLAALRAIQQQRDPSRIALFAGFVALTLIGLFDHYPWTLIQFQAAWWVLLGLSAAPQEASS